MRLAVTDRCNLRCAYCMPAEGLAWRPRKELMSYEELIRLCTLLANMGINKFRITGGEPFVRKDMMGFLQQLSSVQGVHELTLTTNGVLTAPLIPEFKKIGIRSVNLSLDTLNRERFLSITRRDELPQVMNTFEELLRHDIQVKINAVVMSGKNEEDIIELARLTKDLPVHVRFIEEMPFNGSGQSSVLYWDHLRILERLKEAFPSLRKIPDAPFATARHYQAEGYRGQIGIIAAYTRSFCGSCNRLRVTADGGLKTCLYGDPVFNIKEKMRKGMDNGELRDALLLAVSGRARDGWEAEKQSKAGSELFSSMATIGG